MRRWTGNANKIHYYNCLTALEIASLAFTGSLAIIKIFMARAKKWTIWIIIILLVIGGVFWYMKSRAPKTAYTTADVTKGNLLQTVSETGTIKTVNQTDLSFKTSGRVIALYGDVGDTIKKGQLLAQLDMGTLGAQLAQAQAVVTAQRKTLTNLVHHEHDASIPSTTDSRDAQRALLAQAEAGVDAVNSQILDTYMYSPIDGVILKRNVDPFETTVANSPTPVFTVGNPADLYIETEVPESDITKIQIGQKASVTFDALPADQIFPASVTEIDPSSTVIQDVVDYRIKLKLDNNDPRIKSGMSTNIDIATAEKDNVLSIPQRAVKTDSNNKETVDILQPNNTVKTVEVQTGLQGDDGMVEITKGLNMGDKVVTFVASQ
jgi:HlyD family secretion protein